MQNRLSLLRRYVVAFTCIFLALAARLIMDPVLGDAFPFATLFFAVLFVAWYAGFGPALAATLLGAVVSARFLLPPRDSFAVIGSDNQAGLLLYLMVSTGIAILGRAMSAARDRAEDGTSAAIRQREELRTTLASIGDAVIVTDAESRVVSLNPVAESLTEWTNKDAHGRPLDEVFVIVNEQTRRAVESPVARALREGRIVGLANHTVLIAKGGGEHPIDDSAAPIRNHEGQITGVVLVFRDVTERRRAEETNRRLAAIFEFSDDAVISKDLQGRITSWNRGAERIYGYQAVEIVGQQFAILIPEERSHEVQESMRRLQLGERLDHYETVRRRKNGELFDVSVSYSPIKDAAGDVIGAAVITRDVTERKRAEDEIRKRERQLQFITDNAPVLIAHLDANEHFKFVNRPYAERFNQHPRDFIGRSIREVLGDEAYAVLEPHIQQVLKGKRVQYEAEVPYRDLGLQEMHCAYEPEFNAEGEVIGYTAAITNISERKKVERALREIEARFSAIVRYSPAGIFAKDREGRFLLVNEALARLLGRRVEEIVGKRDSDFFPPEICRHFASDDAAVFGSGQSLTLEETIPIGGEPVTVLSVKFPLFDASGEIYGVCGIITDVTEHKRAEEALQTSADQLNLALAAAQLGDWSWDVRSDLVTLSGRAAEIFGIPPGPHMSWKEMQNLLHPDDRNVARERVERSIALRGQYQMQYRVRRPEGSERWVSAAGRVHCGPNGEPLGMYGVIQDITEQKQNEISLEEEARISETLYRVGRALAAELDVERVVKTVTDEATSISGAQFGAFFYNVVNEGGETYTLYSLSGVAPDAFANFPMPRNTPLFETTFRGEGVVRLDDVTADPRYGQNPPFYGMPTRHISVKSYLAAPVISRSGEVLGGLFFGHGETGVFTERHERLVAGIAAQAAVAIDNARLYRQVREAEARLAAIVNHSPATIFLKDREGRYLLVNRRFEELAKVDGISGPYAGKTDVELLPPDLAAAVRRDDGEVIESRQARTYEEIIDLAGERRVGLTTRFPLLNDAGEAYAVCGITLDITERKRAEQDMRFLADASATLAALVDYGSTLRKVAELAVPTFADWCTVDMLDEHGTLQRLAVAHVDPAKVELAHQVHRRFPPDPDAPGGIWHVIRTGQPKLITEITDELIDARVKEPELRQVMRELGFKSYMAVPLRVRGRVLGVISFIGAESGRRYLADDLAVAEDLALRAAVAVENARLYQEVREADRKKDEFLAVLGHELRNPLAPISNALQILKLPGIEAPVQEQAREMMERQVHYMVRLVDDLLDVSRIVRGKVELRRELVDLATVVARAIETSQPFIDAENHDLAVHLPTEPLRVSGDPVRLAQVLANLLNNAARYTERGGQITVRARRLGNEAVLSVRDTGIGIAPEALSQIWDMFVQADRRMKGALGGMGIGLTLVKSLVEMHGGRVTVTSAGLGQGSEFAVYLPLVDSEQPGQASADGSRPASDSARRKVLVVDDNVDAAESLAMLLRVSGHEARMAHDGHTALRLAEAEPPEVAFLDIGMPEMDGYELARRFRDHPRLANVLLVALTGWGQEEDRRRTRAAGFDAHEVKPVAIDALQKLLARRR